MISHVLSLSCDSQFPAFPLLLLLQLQSLFHQTGSRRQAERRRVHPRCLSLCLLPYMLLLFT